MDSSELINAVIWIDQQGVGIRCRSLPSTKQRCNKSVTCLKQTHGGFCQQCTHAFGQNKYVKLYMLQSIDIQNNCIEYTSRQRIFFACHIHFNIGTFSFPLHWTLPPPLSSPEWTVDTPTHFTDGHAQLRTSASERPMSRSQNRAAVCSSPWHCHCATLPEPPCVKTHLNSLNLHPRFVFIHGIDKTFEDYTFCNLIKSR